MTSTRSCVALICLLLFSAAAPSLPAQSARAQPPAAQPPVEVAPEPAPVEQDTEPHYRRPIFRALQNYTLAAGDAVRDVTTIAGDVTIEGHVDGDVVIVMGSARLASTAVIEGSLVVVGGAGKVEGGAKVGRDLVIVGGTLDAPASFSPQGQHVVVGTPWFGEALSDVLPWLTRGLLWGRLIVPDLAWIWAVVAIFFLIYVALNAVFDGAVGATADVITERPLSAFFGGLLVLILAVPVFAILAATVIGLVVVPFLLCGMVVAALLGKTAVARAIGRALMRPELPEGRIAALGAFIVGFVLLVLAYMVPVLGFVTWALATVLGLGAASTTLRSHLRRERRVAAPPEGVVPPSVAPPMGEPFVPAAPLAASEAPNMPIASPPLAPPAPPVFSQGLAQYPRATFLDRLAAFALDCILVAIANGLLDLNRYDDDGSFFFLLLCYHVAFWAWKGTTLGGIICNLRVTRTDGGDLRFVDALVRGLSGIFSIAALGIGCLWMLQDPEKQMWHDKIAGTLVVKAPREVVLA
ncbi:MAG TPA: RDD family protein [Vicinamibacterales bacterium]|jgi:uncharacterized RDD family membrane protein YckC|nr:RDD family protein [Vicinamibacterales bacterium]